MQGTVVLQRHLRVNHTLIVGMEIQQPFSKKNYFPSMPMFERWPWRPRPTDTQHAGACDQAHPFGRHSTNGVEHVFPFVPAVQYLHVHDNFNLLP